MHSEAPGLDGLRLSGCGPWDRQASTCLALLVLGALLSLFWWSHPYLDPENDACMYIVLARNLLAGEGYTLLGDPFILRPPGVSLLIAPLLATWGTDLALLNLFVNLFGVACIALLFVLVRPRLGSPLAFALAVLLWTNPGFRTYCNQVMSDVPGVALALACLLAERSWRTRSPALGLLLGVLIGLCALVRALNVLLVPSILLAALLRRGDRRRSWARGLLLLVGASAVVLPWSLRNARAVVPVPAQQTRIHSYAAGLLHDVARDPTSRRLSALEIAERIPGQLERTTRTLGERFGAAPSSAAAQALGGTLLLALLLVALRRREPAELFGLASLAVISIYFAYADRLALPLFVFGLPALAQVLMAILRRSRLADRPAQLALSLAILALALADARHIPGFARLAARSRQMSELAGFLDFRVPRGAMIAARSGAELGVYLEHHPVYSLHFATKGGSWLTMVDRLDEEQIDHCLLHSPQGDPALLTAADQRSRGRARRMERNLRGTFAQVATVGEWSLYERTR